MPTPKDSICSLSCISSVKHNYHYDLLPNFQQRFLLIPGPNPGGLITIPEDFVFCLGDLFCSKKLKQKLNAGRVSMIKLDSTITERFFQ